MPRLVDNAMAAHGDYVIVALDRKAGKFEMATQRLYQTFDDALAAMPKVHGRDYYICAIEAQHRAVVTHAEIVDPRQKLLPQHDPVPFRR